jgi:hypothetical protein
MPTSSEAEDHLRVIRSLMERSTIYRAISAPVALVGGLTTLLACWLITLKTIQPDTVNIFFLSCWTAVFAITGLSNAYFLWREATRRGDVFLSPGMRAALRALSPNFLIAVVLTYLLAGSSFVLPIIWMMLYGLGLLATQHFAPRSIALLGWAFLAAGLCSLLLTHYVGSLTFGAIWSLANVAMGATFGLFHVIYAACTWPRKSTRTNTGGEP